MPLGSSGWFGESVSRQSLRSRWFLLPRVLNAKQSPYSGKPQYAQRDRLVIDQ